MRRINELHLDHPFAEARLLRDLLRLEGAEVGRKHVGTLMKKMSIEAIYRKRNTSRRNQAHRIYPYLLRDLTITCPNQVWAMDTTYIPMSRGFVYLTAVLDWATRRVLAWRLSSMLSADISTSTIAGLLTRRLTENPPTWLTSTALSHRSPQQLKARQKYHLKKSVSLSKHVGPPLGLKLVVVRPIFLPFLTRNSKPGRFLRLKPDLETVSRQVRLDFGHL